MLTFNVHLYERSSNADVETAICVVNERNVILPQSVHSSVPAFPLLGDPYLQAKDRRLGAVLGASTRDDVIVI